MITTPKIKRRKKQSNVAIRLAVPILFGKYLQPAWDQVYDWLDRKGVKPSGPAIIRYLTPDRSKELDLDVGFTMDKAAKGDDRILADFLPAGHYATLLYTGPYQDKGIFKATIAILEWAKENKVKWNTTLKKGVEWRNGRSELCCSGLATGNDPNKNQNRTWVHGRGPIRPPIQEFA